MTAASSLPPSRRAGPTTSETVSLTIVERHRVWRKEHGGSTRYTDGTGEMPKGATIRPRTEAEDIAAQ